METKEQQRYGILAKETDSVNSLNENTELIQQVEIDGTPFRLTGNEEDGWVGTMGRYRITDPYENKDVLADTLRGMGINWEIMCNIISVIVEETLKAKIEDQKQ